MSEKSDKKADKNSTVSLYVPPDLTHQQLWEQAAIERIKELERELAAARELGELQETKLHNECQAHDNTRRLWEKDKRELAGLRRELADFRDATVAFRQLPGERELAAYENLLAATSSALQTIAKDLESAATGGEGEE